MDWDSFGHPDSFVAPVGEPDGAGRYDLLLLALKAQGWREHTGRLESPSGALWLPETPCSLEQLHGRTAARLFRLLHTDGRSALRSLLPGVTGDPDTVRQELRALLRTLEELSTSGGLEAFFRPHQNWMSRVAQERGLRILKYPNGEPAQHLHAGHPRGGVMICEVRKVVPDRVILRLLWRPSYRDQLAEVGVWQSAEMPNEPAIVEALAPFLVDYLLDFVPPESPPPASGMPASSHPEELPLVFGDEEVDRERASVPLVPYLARAG